MHGEIATDTYNDSVTVKVQQRNCDTYVKNRNNMGEFPSDQDIPLASCLCQRKETIVNITRMIPHGPLAKKQKHIWAHSFCSIRDCFIQWIYTPSPSLSERSKTQNEGGKNGGPAWVKLNV